MALIRRKQLNLHFPMHLKLEQELMLVKRHHWGHPSKILQTVNNLQSKKRHGPEQIKPKDFLATHRPDHLQVPPLIE